MQGSEPWAVRRVVDGISLEVVTVDATPVTVRLEVAQAQLLALDLRWACLQPGAGGEVDQEGDDDDDSVRLLLQVPAPCTRRRRR